MHISLQAFQLGLKLAVNAKQFDVKVCSHNALHTQRIHATAHALHTHLQLIELLLQRKANSADVFMSDLFRWAQAFSPVVIHPSPSPNLRLGQPTRNSFPRYHSVSCVYTLPKAGGLGQLERGL